MVAGNEKTFKMLSVFHYVLGVLIASLSSVFLYLLGTYIIFFSGHESYSNMMVPVTVIYLAVWLLAMLLAFCAMLAGWSLAHCSHYKFISVMALVECFIFPPGTILGVITLRVFMREETRGAFNSKSPTPPPLPDAVSKDWDY